MAYDTTPQPEERICWLSFLGNFSLAAFKMMIGLLGYSRLLIADSLQSSASAIMSSVTLVGIRMNKRPADSKYPYGYGKVEFVVSAMAGIIIAIGAMYLLAASLSSMRSRYIAQPHFIGVVTSIISIIANALMYRYISYYGKGNPSLLLNATNNRIGIYSSLAVLDGMVGAALRMYILEQLGGIIVSVLVLVTSLRAVRKAIHGIMDKSSPPDLLENIKRIASSVEGVRGVSAIRSRRIGQGTWVDLEVRVDAGSLVADANRIAERVSRLITEGIGYVQHVTVDIKPA